MKKLAILGAGSWGLTLAWLAADEESSAWDEVWLWGRSPEKMAALSKDRHVTFPVEVTLPDSLHLSNSLNETLAGADVVLVVVTSAATRSVLQAMKATGQMTPAMVLVNASKGIEFPSLKTLSTVFAEEMPENPFAVLSGPTLAKEILRGLPTACSIASTDEDVAERLQNSLSRKNIFRLYSNTDVVGVELGGSLKNIFAIASGYMEANQLGDNARAALITRGLAEMTRLAVTMGADEQTLYGLSGLGDLLATCNSPLSRNFQVGYQLAQGKSLEQVLTDLRVVAEGVRTTQAVSQLAYKLGFDAPIIQMVAFSISGAEFTPEMLIKGLMSRKLRSEVV